MLYNRNTSGGTSVSGGSIAPRSKRSSAGQVHSLFAGASPQLATPTFSAYSYGADGSFVFTITNYDSLNSYTVTSSAGTPVRSTNSITVSGLGNGGTATVSVTATRSGYSDSNVGQIVGQSKPACTSCGTATYGLNGCNGATCGIIACGSGSCPAYDSYVYNSPTPNPCVGCAASIGGWYCCTVTCAGACG